MKQYIPKTEEERKYIEAYDPTKYYPNPAVTVDIAVYAFDDRYNRMKLLLIERGGFPYKGDMAVPGGFLDYNEPIESAVLRELLEETGIENVDAHLFCVMSHPDRDPRQRVITPEYLALTNLHDITPKAGDDAARAGWYDVMEFREDAAVEGSALIKSYTMRLVCGNEEITLKARAVRDYSSRQVKSSFEVTEDGGMAFDHGEAVIKSFIALREMLASTDIVCGALGRRFCREAYNDVLRAAKLDPALTHNQNLFEDGEDVSLLPGL